MGMSYDVNQFNEVVPYTSGRKSIDTTTYRELTEYEKQLLEEIKELKEQLNDRH